MKMLITLEPHGIFGSNFVHLCILTLSSHWYERGDEAPPSVILAGQAILVKILTGVNQNVLPVLSTETLMHIWLSTEYYGFRPSSTAVDTVS